MSYFWIILNIELLYVVNGANFRYYSNTSSRSQGFNLNLKKIAFNLSRS